MHSLIDTKRSDAPKYGGRADIRRGPFFVSRSFSLKEPAP